MHISSLGETYEESRNRGAPAAGRLLQIIRPSTQSEAGLFLDGLTAHASIARQLFHPELEKDS
jgi:hypothetical protein